MPSLVQKIKLPCVSSCHVHLISAPSSDSSDLTDDGEESPSPEADCPAYDGLSFRAPPTKRLKTSLPFFSAPPQRANRKHTFSNEYLRAVASAMLTSQLFPSDKRRAPFPGRRSLLESVKDESLPSPASRSRVSTEKLTDLFSEVPMDCSTDGSVQVFSFLKTKCWW